MGIKVELGAQGEKASRARRPSAVRPRLLWYHLVGVTFFAVCGGDYGLEDTVGAAGPAITLIGLLLLPWFWSLPIALMTAELSAMIPETGGYVVWVHRAFGPFWAHQNALWNLVSNLFDNALYPVMFVDYLRYFPALRVDGWRRWLISISMLTSVTSLNLVGVDVVASASNVFALLVISPFAALALAGLPEVRCRTAWPSRNTRSLASASASLQSSLTPALPRRCDGVRRPRSHTPLGHRPALATRCVHLLHLPPLCRAQLKPSAWLLGPPPPGVRWGTFLSVLLWNTSGYDSVGALAAEVQNPGRDFPRAMIATIALVTVVYLLPLLVAISMDEANLEQWTDGHFTVVAAEVRAPPRRRAASHPICAAPSAPVTP